MTTTFGDPKATSWIIQDPILRLRVLGSNAAFDLASGSRWRLGVGKDCEFRLVDPSGRVSRRHAELTRNGEELVLTDSGSRNGTRVDGSEIKTISLAPGMEVEFGAVKLIVESEALLALRELIRRVIGYADDKAADVDFALKTVRDMAQLRLFLLIRGSGSLVGVARRLHQATLGNERAFVVHTKHEPGMTSLDRATDGMVYFDGEALPRDILRVATALRKTHTRVRIVIGAQSLDRVADVATVMPSLAQISLPEFGQRASELERILQSYAKDARLQLGAPDTGLRDHDLKWITASPIPSHDDAEEIMLRVVAARNWGLRGGATRLGITHAALSKYLSRRRIPT